MRKVLLASTAQVAVTGVASADVSISAYSEALYTEISDDQTTPVDGAMSMSQNIFFSFSESADNGLSFGLDVEIQVDGNTDNTDANTEESKAHVSGDFGTVVFGSEDAADTLMRVGHNNGMTNTASGGDGWATFAYANGDAVTAPSGVNAGGGTADGGKIIYKSPSLSGFSFAASWDDGGTGESDTAFGAKYATEMSGVGVTIGAGVYDSGESTDTNEMSNAGIALSMGDLSVGYNQSSAKTGTTKDYQTTQVGVNYALNDDVTIGGGYTKGDDDITNGDELELVEVGLTYSIAPGLTFAVGYGSFEVTDTSSTSNSNDGSYTTASIGMSF
jgi:hypothetical protein